MAEDRVSVEYSKKVSIQVADGKYETVSLGGSVAVDVAEGQSWQDAYEAGYVTFKLIVDQLIDEAMPKASVTTLPGEKIAPKPQSSWSAPQPHQQVQANEPVAFSGCRVFKVETALTKTNKEYAKVRIGHQDIPGQYITAKSFEPQVVNRLKGLRADDIVDIRGYFDPWRSDNTKFDLMVQSVDMAVAV